MEGVVPKMKSFFQLFFFLVFFTSGVLFSQNVPTNGAIVQSSYQQTVQSDASTNKADGHLVQMPPPQEVGSERLTNGYSNIGSYALGDKTNSSSLTPNLMGDKNVPAPITIDLVTVGDPGNNNDFSDHGAVVDVYQIGKYDVTAEQYCAYLNAVATGHLSALYHERMGSDLAVASITRTGSPGSYHYSVIPGREKLPIVYVSLIDAARFCNWVEHGQLHGIEGEKSLETGAFDYKDNSWVINSNSQWSLPSENEWYKAAFYNNTTGTYWSYPTQSETPPGMNVGSEPNQANYYNLRPSPRLTPVGAFSGSPGPYGTFDMGGNVYQLTRTFLSDPETGVSKVVMKGGSWKSQSADALSCNSTPDYPSVDELRPDIGFRLVFRKQNGGAKGASTGALDYLPQDIKDDIEKNFVGNAFNALILSQIMDWVKSLFVPAIPPPVAIQNEFLVGELNHLRTGVRSIVVASMAPENTPGAMGVGEVMESLTPTLILPEEAAAMGWLSVEMVGAVASGLVFPVALGAAAYVSYECLPHWAGIPLSIALGGCVMKELLVPVLEYSGKVAFRPCCSAMGAACSSVGGYISSIPFNEYLAAVPGYGYACSASSSVRGYIRSWWPVRVEVPPSDPSIVPRVTEFGEPIDFMEDEPAATPSRPKVTGPRVVEVTEEVEQEIQQEKEQREREIIDRIAQEKEQRERERVERIAQERVQNKEEAVEGTIPPKPSSWWSNWTPSFSGLFGQRAE
ncbi:MAG: hypothetical protein A3F67_10825 [Verrucomicrobia bacterium RIFCSPHIGHO2_12_FULL_41_10]|nr:MAG: hypothetical protein A3F67_10825 [Verrucomicrobia bacterium RIFCSPHIGHO2_12_FULL_41_10]